MVKNYGLNILLLDDNEDDVDALIECINENPNENLKIFVAKCAEDAIFYLKKHLFHIVSLDQRIPFRENGIVSDDNLKPVLECYDFSQPISDGIVFTGYPSLSPGIKATKSKLKYLQKDVYSEEKWNSVFQNLVENSLNRILDKKRSEYLPYFIIRSINSVVSTRDPWKKISVWKDIYEIALRLYTMLLFSVSYNYSKNAQLLFQIIKNLYKSKMTNNAWQIALTKTIEFLDNQHEMKRKKSYLEINKYLRNGTGDFLKTLDFLRVNLRNRKFAHTRHANAQVYEEFIKKIKLHLICLMEAYYLFSKNPLLDEFEQNISSSDNNQYYARDLRGHQLNPRKILIESEGKIKNEKIHWCIYGKEDYSIENISLLPFLITQYDENDLVRMYYLRRLDGPIYKDFMSDVEIRVPSMIHMVKKIQ